MHAPNTYLIAVLRVIAELPRDKGSGSDADAGVPRNQRLDVITDLQARQIQLASGSPSSP
jgi:hypothetical protein